MKKLGNIILVVFGLSIVFAGLGIVPQAYAGAGCTCTSWQPGPPIPCGIEQGCDPPGIKTPLTCVAEYCPSTYCPPGTYWATNRCVKVGTSGGPTTCFPAGTKVKMADGTSKTIETIKSGDRVISGDEKGDEKVSIVSEIEKPIRENMCRIDFSSGKKLELTSEHPVMTTQGWKSIDPKKMALENPELPAGQLTVGDQVIREKGIKDEVREYSCWSTQVPTYNLLLDNGLHTYYANGVLVHNKAGRCPGGCCDGGRNSNTCGLCGNPPCCTSSAPTPVVLVSPISGEQVRVGVPTTFNWNGTSNWGVSCTGTNHEYQFSAGKLINNLYDDYYTSDFINASITSFDWIPDAADGVGPALWEVDAINGSLDNWSDPGSICVEGFDKNDPAYVSDWTACDANHKHTRTCKEDCGTDDCSATTLVEDCTGVVRGTLFDASDLPAGYCPAFDPATGWATGLVPGTEIAWQYFGLDDWNVTPPHPWGPIPPSVLRTNGSGNYSVSLYSPANYQFDFSLLADKYYLDGGPKSVCISEVASVTPNLPTCDTQPCTKLFGYNFGFWRIYSGWWQVEGGSVHGEKGVTSVIPSSLLTEMSLILPDISAGTRRGLLTYGTQTPYMLGTNPNAKVSTSLWQAKSNYDGVVYDWSFYDKRFNNFTKTEWDGTSALSYNDGGLGYQIFRNTTGVNNFDYSPAPGEKVIVLVNGNVNVTADIVVPNGAFLAIIAKGTITFNTAVSEADGWYVASKISVPCIDVDGTAGCDKTDLQFLGNGSFVAWGDIDMARDRGITNNTEPSEYFTYRNDLYDNAPTPMKVFNKVFKQYIP